MIKFLKNTKKKKSNNVWLLIEREKYHNAPCGNGDIHSPLQVFNFRKVWIFLGRRCLQSGTALFKSTVVRTVLPSIKPKCYTLDQWCCDLHINPNHFTLALLTFHTPMVLSELCDNTFTKLTHIIWQVKSLSIQHTDCRKQHLRNQWWNLQEF